MQHGGGLLNGADDVACPELVADLGNGVELPLLVVVERGNVNASLEVGARDLHDLIERSLDTVVDSADKTGTQLNREGSAGGLNLLSGAETRGLLINLDRSSVAVHFYDFAYKTLFAYADNVIHIGVAHTVCNYQRSRDF